MKQVYLTYFKIWHNGKLYFFILMGSVFSTLVHAAELEVSWVYEPKDIAYNPDLSWAGGYVDPVVSSPVLD